jgi:hypothetical protein
MALQRVSMVCGDACHPSELGSHLKPAFSLMAHPPTPAFSWVQLREAYHHSALQLRPQLQLRQKQEQEHRLQCLQD